MSWSAHLSVGTLLVAALALTASAPAQEQQTQQEPATAAEPAKPLAGYSVLVVQKFNVEPEAAEAGFDQDRAKLLRDRVIAQLHEQNLFDRVLDESNLPAAPPSPDAKQGNAKPKLLLAATVNSFDPGSRVKRSLLGFGAGAAVLNVTAVFRDAATGKLLLRAELQQKFWFGAFGGSKTDAMDKTAEGLAKSLARDIENNR